MYSNTRSNDKLISHLSSSKSQSHLTPVHFSIRIQGYLPKQGLEVLSANVVAEQFTDRFAKRLITYKLKPLIRLVTLEA